MRRGLVLAITLLVVGPARAHVAPSVDDNNRFLKLTPQADRVRLAYTVFFGEVPGAQMRPSLDADHDGTISDDEADRFGKKLATDVAAMVDVSVDGVQTPVAWTEVSVGLGAPSVRAGAFSVDLVVSLCLAGGRHHTLLLRDRFRVPRPGETEVKIEDTPGIAISAARVGSVDDPSRIFKFVGPGGPLSDDGLELVFDVGDKAVAGGGCTVTAPAEAPRSWIVAVAVGVLAAAGGGFVLFAGRRTTTRRE